ncbi:MAG: 30S ribosomal protein S1 [Dissulfuribacterales bacterium]
MENMVNANETTQQPTQAAAEMTAPASFNKMDEITDMNQLFESGLTDFHQGDIIDAKVVRIDKDHVMVDVGYKSEIPLPMQDFIGIDQKITVQPGDTIQVLIERWDSDTGSLRLSYGKLLKRQAWDEIKNAFDNQTPIKGTILNRVKGGLEVLLGDVKSGIKAFLPLSQIDLKPVGNAESLIGDTIECLVVKCNRSRENVVVSRRALLEKERNQSKEKTLKTLEVGQVREGIVKNVMDYGVFVDIGGIDGLLHVSDISWGRAENPAKIFKTGDKVTVKILSFDPATEKISIGIKQLTEDPWLTISERYHIGDRVTGKVVSMTDYGAFVELEEGVEGMIHISEMSWTKRIKKPSQIMKTGDRVEAAVLNVDTNAKRISLSLRQLEPNPWDTLEERYPIGTVIEGTVKNITDFGLFMGIEEGIDGLVHLSDLSWSKKINHPNQLYKKGDRIQAVVLNIDKEKERFSLGVKQLHPEPWATVPERYPLGSIITGKVTNVTDFGIFVEIEDGIEGLIHVSEISNQKIKTPVGMYEPGQEISAKVINISTVDKRIGLSIKKINEESEKTYYEEYTTNVQKGPATLGSLLKEARAKTEN